MRLKLVLPIVGILIQSSGARAQVIPIPVSGYNQDVVVEAGAPANASGVTTATMDAGIGNTGGTWYEQGFNTSAPLTGIPARGTTIVSAAAPDHSYLFPASYGPGNGTAGTTNDAFVVGQGSGSPTIAFITPARYSALSLLGSSGHGPNSVDYVITFADSTTQSGTLSVGDWFNGTPVAYNANGRVTVNTGAFDNVNAGNPRLYSFDFTLSNTLSPVTSVALTSSSVTSTAAFFALSGTLAPVPEPTTLSLTAIGMLIGGMTWRKRRLAAQV
jgi:hypothetical protein